MQRRHHGEAVSTGSCSGHAKSGHFRPTCRNEKDSKTSQDSISQIRQEVDDLRRQKQEQADLIKALEKQVREKREIVADKTAKLKIQKGSAVSSAGQTERPPALKRTYTDAEFGEWYKKERTWAMSQAWFTIDDDGNDRCRLCPSQKRRNIAAHCTDGHIINKGHLDKVKAFVDGQDLYPLSFESDTES